MKPSELREGENARTCSKCHKLKPLDNLRRNKSCLLGYQALCLDCDKARVKGYYASNQDAVKNRIASYYQTEAGKRVRKKTQASQLIKFPEKTKARQAVRYALLTGKLVKPTHCDWCNEAQKLDAHHEDYDKPLDVIWMCRTCHTAAHGRLVGGLV